MSKKDDFGYKPSSTDPYKLVNGSSFIKQEPGKGTIIRNDGRTNTYEKDLSATFLAKRLK